MDRRAASRLAAFALVLLGCFATAYGLGLRYGTDAVAEPTGHDTRHDGDDGHQHGAAPQIGAVDGESNGYQLVRVATGGAETDLRFTVRTPNGDTLTDYPEAHGARLHLVVIRPDLSGFQHLHPDIDAEGVISIADRFDGAHQFFFDFVAGDTDTALVLGAMVDDEQTVDEVALPPVADQVTVDDTAVRRDGLTFTARATTGEAVDGLQPYLGQPAHLVAVRADDLAYSHLHAAEGQPDGVFRFEGELTPGTYRVFVQFGLDDEVVTAAFTVDVGAGGLGGTGAGS
jgi:hypothetical protein